MVLSRVASCQSLGGIERSDPYAALDRVIDDCFSLSGRNSYILCFVTFYLFWKGFSCPEIMQSYAWAYATRSFLAGSGETGSSNSGAVITAAAGLALITLIVPTTIDGNAVIIVAHLVAFGWAQSFVWRGGTPLGDL